MQEEVTGNTQGLKASEIKALERLYRRRVAPTEVVSRELAQQLAMPERRSCTARSAC